MFWRLLRENRNYRRLWLGQIVSEVGDHFNTIAVLSLTLELTGSGIAVGGVMLSRTLPASIAGPLAGVVLDRLDRRAVMVASDLVRAVFALLFVLVLTHRQIWLLYVLSGLLMFASPFFTAGRSAILPTIAACEQLHTANAMTQTTAWLTLAIGTMLGGVGTMRFGYEMAFVANALSFLSSAWAVYGLRSPAGHFRASRGEVEPHSAGAFYRDFRSSLRYIRRTPLVLAIALVWVGWATGGGAAQMLFTLFGQIVFGAGAAGIGWIWGSAGLGLVTGGVLAHRLGPLLSFRRYKHTISLLVFAHGAAYILFSMAPAMAWAVVWIAISRISMGANNVLNRTALLYHVPDQFRGRVFSTVETMMQAMMMLSLTAASAATEYYSPRAIAFVAGCCSTSTAFFWAWANAAGKLPEPRTEPADGEAAYQAPVTPA
jgi:MFS family permease